MLISDLDHFKRIDDSYGHVAGDRVIQFAASVLESHSRVHDAAARIGGEEFALLLVNTGEKKRELSPSVSAWRSVPGEPFTGANDDRRGVYTTYDNSVTAEAVRSARGPSHV